MNSGTTVAAAAASSSSSPAFGDDQHTVPHHNHNGWSNNNHHGGGFSASTGSTSKKPIRRRSRVSKKTPITLLNADAASFRSLVQQFTGCPHPRPTSSISFDHSADPTAAPLQAAHGPLNLNFQLGTVQPTTHNRRPSTHDDDRLQQSRSYSPPGYHHHRHHHDVNPYDNPGAVSYQSTLSGGDDHGSEMLTTSSPTNHNDDPVMRMGSHNLDMVQELLMVDLDHRDDFGFFQ